MHPSGSTPRVPIELFRTIVESLDSDNSSLCAIALSSMALRHESQRVLFRDITTLRTVAVHIKFLHTVTSSPTRLALLVRSYGQTFSDHTDEDLMQMMIAHHGDDLRYATRDALCVMRNLKGLGFSGLHVDPSSLLDACARSFNLEKFQWLYATNNLEWLTKEFLPYQSTLEYLGISLDLYRTTSAHLQHILATVIPQVGSLTGNWTAIETILPISNIKTLEWIEPYAASFTSNVDVSDLAPALKRIEALSCGHLFEPRELILDYFQSVTVLELKINKDALLQCIDVLARFPALHTFILSRYYDHANAILPDVPERDQWICFILEKTGATLQLIYAQIDIKMYARFRRSGGAVQAVDARQVRRFWTCR